MTDVQVTWDELHAEYLKEIAAKACLGCGAVTEQLRADYVELYDLYTTYRGLVADGQDITTLIMVLRKKADDAQAEVERLRAALREIMKSDVTWVSVIAEQALA